MIHRVLLARQCLDKICPEVRLRLDSVHNKKEAMVIGWGITNCTTTYITIDKQQQQFVR